MVRLQTGMDGSTNRLTRTTRNQQVSYKETSSKNTKVADKPKTSNSDSKTGPSSSTAGIANAKNQKKSFPVRPSLNATRLSTSSQNLIAPPSENSALEERVRALELRLNTTEACLDLLKVENSNLRQTINELQSEVSRFKEQDEHLRTSLALSRERNLIGSTRTQR